MCRISCWTSIRNANLRLILTVLFSGVLVGTPGARAQTPESPNLIVVMSDDLSSNLMDGLLATGYAPNIQRYLIDEGIVFENSFVTNSLCCPSRATFLTGQYTHNHQVFSNTTDTVRQPGILWDGWFPKDGEPGRNESTIATALQAAGYATGHVGKYLTGYGLAAPDGEPAPKLYVPPGWDDWQGLLDRSTYQVYDYEMNDNGSVVTYGSNTADYQTDVLAGRAVEFIDESAAAEQPFFLFVAPLAPHLEIIGAIIDPLDNRIRPAPRHKDLLDGDPSNEEIPNLIPSPSFNEADVSDKPSCPPDVDPETPDPICIGDKPLLQAGVDVPRLGNQYKMMMASMIAVDDLVGAIMDSLVANGIDGDTIIFFTSDNGWLYGEHRFFGKKVVYEESIRVPLYVRAPGFASGATASQVVLNNDLAPTLAALAGATLTHDADGASLIPLLAEPQSLDWHRKGFLVENWWVERTGVAAFYAVRYLNATNDFVFAATHSDPADPDLITHQEYYNMDFDPHQVRSATLAAAHLSALTDYVAALKSCAGASCRNWEALVLP